MTRPTEPTDLAAYDVDSPIPATRRAAIAKLMIDAGIDPTDPQFSDTVRLISRTKDEIRDELLRQP